MKQISYFSMETVCSEFFLRVTDEEEVMLKSMSRDEAREWFIEHPTEDCRAVDYHDSELPHAWEDSDNEYHDIEPVFFKTGSE